MLLSHAAVYKYTLLLICVVVAFYWYRLYSVQNNLGWSLWLSVNERQNSIAQYLKQLNSHDPALLQCSSRVVDDARYMPLKKSSVFIALILKNANDLLPQLGSVLIRLLSHIDENRLHLSIYESGSSDATPKKLRILHEHLLKIGLRQDQLTFSLDTPDASDLDTRIDRLAEARNQALKPLLESTLPFDSVLFMNDVYTCEQDILELLFQRQVLQDADQVCGTDWNTISDDRLKLYDIWVSRGLNGNLLYDYRFENGRYTFLHQDGFDLTTALFSPQANDQLLWLQGLPIPVYSCWGGQTAIRASLFRKDGLQFRSASQATSNLNQLTSGPTTPWRQMMADKSYLEDDCNASECSLLARDIWNLRQHRAKIVIASRSRCAYTAAEYKKIAALIPFDWEKPLNEEKIDWAQIGGPERVLCMPHPHEWTTRPYLVAP